MGLGSGKTLLPIELQQADLADVAQRLRLALNQELLEYGAIVVTGIEADRFQSLVTAVTPALMEYDYASTPRTAVEGRVYTSTEYPSRMTIPLHNEMAYTTAWPNYLWFYCVRSAESGGETPICDSREVYRRIDPKVRDRFREHGVAYTRTYNTGLDVTWQQAFATEDRLAVEAYCQRAGIDYRWEAPDVLRTRQICQSEAVHPMTGEPVWFNQAHLFHVSSLPPEVRTNLAAVVEPEDFPRNAYFGDGTPIDDAVLDDIRALYREIQVARPWSAGDLLLIDNLLVAHGREPYVGERRVLVAMAQ
ncbi:MAG: TauD/TfdA family dioxygenase [Pseudomonadota bacterium]